MFTKGISRSRSFIPSLAGRVRTNTSEDYGWGLGPDHSSRHWQVEWERIHLKTMDEVNIYIWSTLTLSSLNEPYTRRQIKNDQPGSHDFRRFLRQFSTDCLEILQRPFSIKILTGVKISENSIYYLKSYTICHVIKF